MRLPDRFGTMIRRWLLHLRDERGQDAAEYVLLVVLIGLAITASLTVMATSIDATYQGAANCISVTAQGPAPGGGPGGGNGKGGGTGAPGQGKGKGGQGQSGCP